MSYLEQLAATVLLAALVVLLGCGQRRQPDVILIVADTLRPDYLGAYGFVGPISPNLDELAGESVLFTNCFSQAPWTKPSVASLLTSLYPQSHGVTNHEGKYWDAPGARSQTGVLPERTLTLAEALRSAGYETAAFIANPWIASEYGFAQGFEVYDDHAAETFPGADQLIDKARSWLEARSTDRPLFLYLHFLDPHAPYDAPESDYALLRNRPSLGANRPLRESELPIRLRQKTAAGWVHWYYIEAPAEWVTPEMQRELGHWRARYASGIRAFDRRLGTLIDLLRERGILDRAYLVVTSDHGEELFEHGGWSHGRDLFDHQLHVPLWIRQPGARGAGRSVDALVELVDLMPTLVSLSGLEVPSEAQGRDLSGLLSAEADSGHAAVFATATTTGPDLRSIRTRDHKLVLDLESGATALFDLRHDEAEQHDVSATQADLVEHLTSQLRAHLRDNRPGSDEMPETTELSPETRRRLEALGYLAEPTAAQESEN